MTGGHEGTEGDHDGGREAADQTNIDRDGRADDRDETAEAHDMDAGARDYRAHERDIRAEIRDEAAGAVDREAASDRAEAQRDRRAAARDREDAARDRAAAWSDRAVSEVELEASSIDGLTGVYRRDTGLVELEREITRAKRTGRGDPFVLAFVDVDCLKATNDSLGHIAGDQLLRHVAEVIRANLRSYNLIIRFGGDEFVCALPGLDVEAAAERFVRINSDLASTRQASVTVGLVELLEDESVESFIVRADKAMYAQRQKRQSASDPR